MTVRSRRATFQRWSTSGLTPDLRADDGDAVVVELLAEEQPVASPCGKPETTTRELYAVARIASCRARYEPLISIETSAPRPDVSP